ncbi:PH domain-containing protein [Pseudonocardia sp.]|jgi:putative membrane protein|uniref:PH domain-containing protein n=1 Tax=Pseudonocardia sp. TaxID=60912 RepID=UPI0031FDB99D
MTSDTDAPTTIETPWRRLDKRMLVVSPIAGLVRLLPVAVILLVTGQRGDPMRLWIPLGIGVLVVIGGVVRWRTTQYRITGDRVELHTGWLRRQRRSVPRDRIRTVDLTAKLLHRIFGLSVVHIGAASGSPTENAGLTLDAVSKAEADRLRRELLDRSLIASGPTATGPTADHPAPPPATELARLRWSWLRFAPLTFSAIAGVGAIGAAVFNLFGELGVSPRDISAVDDAADRLTTTPIWVAVAVLAALLLVVAVIGAMVLFAERWFGYQLTREAAADGPGWDPAGATASTGIGTGTLRVRRGLLTRRSLSVSEQRLRGVEVVEPLLLRAGHGAYSKALSTGLTRSAQGGALQPPCPRAEAHRVAAAALREHQHEVTLAPLRRHPRAALRRRLTRALAPTAVLVAGVFAAGAAVPVLAGLGLPSLLLLPLAGLVALDRYRNLGHELTTRYLVSRHGSVQRRTVALQRAGVIGWTFRQSLFQRRAGLVAVEAITAAGAGGYEVLDIAAADGVALADAAVPHLLTPFLAAATPEEPQLDHR